MSTHLSAEPSTAPHLAYSRRPINESSDIVTSQLCLDNKSSLQNTGPFFYRLSPVEQTDDHKGKKMPLLPERSNQDLFTLGLGKEARASAL